MTGSELDGLWSIYEIIHICTTVADESEEWRIYCDDHSSLSVN